MGRLHTDTERQRLARIEELEARTRALDETLEYEERLGKEAQRRAFKDARLAEGRRNAELDDAVDESFPASDPASPVRAGREGDRVAEAKVLSAVLDDALDDTFPASDPPALIAPKAG